MAAVIRPGIATLLLAGTSAVLAAEGPAISDGRLLYILNCMGCHPTPEGLAPASGMTHGIVGEFAQTPKGRIFFMRVPGMDQPPLNEKDNEKLIAEILNWKKACPLLLSHTPWNNSNLK